MIENQKEELLYKVVPYFIEKRGNLKMIGVSCPVEYKQVKDTLVVHIKERLIPADMESVSSQLKQIFGEPVILFALEPDISFFVAEPMTEAETKEFRSILKETINENVLEEV